tara:strand:- start:602 stop:778 length:177 start_codon:yes stop_codon:yes gene_type:complete
MDPFDPAIQSTMVSGWKPLLSLGIFAALGAFFFGALFTAVSKGIKEEGWFKNKKDDGN